MRDYLTAADILGIHSVMLQRYGGASGIRDKEGLEAAVFRPQNGYYQNIVEEGCALMESILVNHPFLDGNKRTAFAAFDVFLKINGYTVKADNATLYKAILKWLESKTDERYSEMVETVSKFVEQS